MFRKTLIILAVTFWGTHFVQSQNLEIGLQGGSSFMSSDISGDKFDFGVISPMAGIYLRQNYSAKFAYRYFLSASSYTQVDANKERNYKLESIVAELGFMAEWNFIGNPLSESSNYTNKFIPYLGVGVGVTGYDSNLFVGENSSDFHPQDALEETPDLSALVVGALGCRYDLGKLTIGLETAVKYHATDKIDGLIRSANEDTREYALSGSLHLSYQFGYYKAKK